MGPKRRRLRKSTSLGKENFIVRNHQCERTLKLKSVNENAAGLLAQLLVSQITLNYRSRDYFSRDFTKSVIYELTKFQNNISFKVSQNLATFSS